MKLEMIVQGGKQIEHKLEERHQRLKRSYRLSMRAAARVFQKSLRAALPRKTGKLRRHVGIYPLGEHDFKVKVTGHTAHLVLGDTQAHEIAPRALEALSFKGADHPFARAMIPAHRGDHTVILRARAEGSEAASQAAKEVLRNGR